ncbi:hypothetical protein FQA39_LY12944 [Lamprigera yunnana]|nr:hypothetical protein FQA39_LY12944 [Lamprigera yunnana]
MDFLEHKMDNANKIKNDISNEILLDRLVSASIAYLIRFENRASDFEEKISNTSLKGRKMKNILVRYGELTLKGNNRKDFIAKLIQNIKFKLKRFDRNDVKYLKQHNSLILDVADEIANECERDLDKIIETVLLIAKRSNAKTFKLDASRKDKSFPISSTELKQKVAPVVLREMQTLKVDVKNPELKIEIIVKQDHVEIFDSRIQGIKGLPVGVSGKGLSLLSGEKLAKYNHQHFSFYVCNFTMLLQELQHIKDESYKITIMRRMFMRIANQLAEKINAKALITGESLGQVASQTIESINVINEVSKLPILRPLITFDKEEIIKISNQIDTYETSILPFDDACSLFVPKQPVTKPKSKIAVFQEDNIL